jgi:hypothetical protein
VLKQGINAVVEPAQFPNGIVRTTPLLTAQTVSGVRAPLGIVVEPQVRPPMRPRFGASPALMERVGQVERGARGSLVDTHGLAPCLDRFLAVAAFGQGQP